MNISKSKVSDEEIRQLVIERLKTLPSGRKISIGSKGDFDKDQLIYHVTNDDEVGKTIVQIQLSYLRSLKKGILFDD